ncbi:hypothetical protein ACHHYP_07837 [Achlya hypogyna]|uniref:B9 domain-containing protein 2 n=1 Tax=Achlya hypogyna TaxID=1202772 RepID=A0A1V9ZLE7_ACHHY|nr:hypothetical protein ACHHYP_07837 [Achlya hypogyna]
MGELVGGSGFEAGAGFVCKWSVDYGEAWEHLAGPELGQTHVDSPASTFSRDVIWSHPIDVQFTTYAMQVTAMPASWLHPVGWPRLLLQVWAIDEHENANICGYGFTHVPSTPGPHQLSVHLWRPKGSEHEELAALFLGQTTQLVSDDVIFGTAWADRCRLRTVPSGQV